MKKNIATVSGESGSEARRLQAAEALLGGEKKLFFSGRPYSVRWLEIDARFVSSTSMAIDFVSKKSRIGLLHAEKSPLKVGTSLKKWSRPKPISLRPRCKK